MIVQQVLHTLLKNGLTDRRNEQEAVPSTAERWDGSGHLTASLTIVGDRGKKRC